MSWILEEEVEHVVDERRISCEAQVVGEQEEGLRPWNRGHDAGIERTSRPFVEQRARAQDGPVTCCRSDHVQRAAAGVDGSLGLGRGRSTGDEKELQAARERSGRIEKNGQLTVLADRYEGKRLNSPNDLVYKSDGALYFTDPPFGLPKFFDDPRKELPYSGVFRAADGKCSC